MLRILLLALLAAAVLAQEKEIDTGRMRALVDELNDPERRDAALRELYEACRKGMATGMAFRIVVTDDLSGETMTGSWTGDGKSARYSLNSLGEGAYELSATVEDPDGNTQKISDKGSLAELRKKYRFLKDFLIFSPGAFRVIRKPPLIDEPRPTPVAGLGIEVRPPSEALRHQLSLPEGAGLVVERVEPGSRLERFDVVVERDGEPVTKAAQLEGAKVLRCIRKARPVEVRLAPADEK